MRCFLSFSILAALFSLVSCGGDAADGSSAAEPKSESGMSKTRYVDVMYDIQLLADNVPYSNGFGIAQGQERRLSIHAPQNDGEKNRPAIVFVGGGGFVDVSQDCVHDLSVTMARKGYVSVVPAYSCISTPEFAKDSFEFVLKKAAEDLDEAVRWIKSKSEKYGVNANEIYIVGYSTGADVVVNYYYTDALVEDAEREGVRGVVAISGGNILKSELNKDLPKGATAKCLVVSGKCHDRSSCGGLDAAKALCKYLGDISESCYMEDECNKFVRGNEEDELQECVTSFLKKNMLR